MDSFTSKVAGHGCGMCENQVTPSCGTKANASPNEKHDTLPLYIQLSVLEDCSGYCSVGCDKYLSLDTERVTAMVLQAVSLCAQ